MKDARPKTSTDYVREFRERMRRAGLVKKDVWIRPEYAEDLAAVEKRFRAAPGDRVGEDPSAGMPAAADASLWTLPTLHRALEGAAGALAGSIEVRRIEGTDPTLQLVMRDYGDLPVFVAVGGLQIVVQAVMWPVEHVADPDAFNAFVLRTHKYVPLTTMGIEPVAGIPCYIMFGSLDTQSSLANVLFEIETLAENVIAAVDIYCPFLREDVRPQEVLA